MDREKGNVSSLVSDERHATCMPVQHRSTQIRLNHGLESRNYFAGTEAVILPEKHRAWNQRENEASSLADLCYCCSFSRRVEVGAAHRTVLLSISSRNDVQMLSGEHFHQKHDSHRNENSFLFISFPLMSSHRLCRFMPADARLSVFACLHILCHSSN